MDFLLKCPLSLLSGWIYGSIRTNGKTYIWPNPLDWIYSYVKVKLWKGKILVVGFVGKFKRTLGDVMVAKNVVDKTIIWGHKIYIKAKKYKKAKIMYCSAERKDKEDLW